MPVWTQDDLDKLERAIATGAQEVSYSTGTVKYRSLSEMERIRLKMRNALGLSNPVRRITPITSKGL